MHSLANAGITKCGNAMSVVKLSFQVKPPYTMAKSKLIDLNKRAHQVKYLMECRSCKEYNEEERALIDSFAIDAANFVSQTYIRSGLSKLHRLSSVSKTNPESHGTKAE